MMMEINELKEVVKLKDEAIIKSRLMLEAAHEDVARMASICGDPSAAFLNSNLYKAGSTKSDVFRG